MNQVHCGWTPHYWVTVSLLPGTILALSENQLKSASSAGFSDFNPSFSGALLHLKTPLKCFGQCAVKLAVTLYVANSRRLYSFHHIVSEPHIC